MNVKRKYIVINIKKYLLCYLVGSFLYYNFNCFIILMEKKSRRSFIKNFFFFAGALSACNKGYNGIGFMTSDISDDILNFKFDSKITLVNNGTLLFIGDSITDALRDRTVFGPNDEKGLGEGFVKQIALGLQEKEEFENISVYNRGISGDKIDDLLNRWDKDAIELKPTTISILIGVNDLRWKRNPGNYLKSYRKLLRKTREQLPDAKIILCEPFILPNIAEYNILQQYLHEYRKIIRALAKEFDTVFVPYYEALFEEAKTVSASNLLSDGFHPASLGIEVLKKKWLEFLV